MASSLIWKKNVKKAASLISRIKIWTIKTCLDSRLQNHAMEQFFTVCLFCILSCTIAQEKHEEWGYVTVRPGAHMFWWLYRSPADWQNKPLVMWLQVRMRDVPMYYSLVSFAGRPWSLFNWFWKFYRNWTFGHKSSTSANNMGTILT